MQAVPAQDLRGKTVIDGAGNAVGEVDDVLLDTDEWRVAGLRVKLRREAADDMGAAHGTFRSAVVDFPIGAIHAAGQAVVLNVPIASLREASQQVASTR